MNRIQRLVGRFTVAVVLAMLIYVPADQVLNGSILGFDYRFLWQLGADPQNPFKVFTPNFGLMAVHVFGVSVAAMFLVKSFKC